MSDVYKLRYSTGSGAEIEYYENKDALLVDLLDYTLKAETYGQMPWFDRMLTRAFIRNKDEPRVTRILGVYQMIDSEWVELEFHYEAPKVTLDTAV